MFLIGFIFTYICLDNLNIIVLNSGGIIIIYNSIMNLKIVVNNGFRPKFWLWCIYGKFDFTTLKDCVLVQGMIALRQWFVWSIILVRISFEWVCSMLNVYWWFRRTHVNCTWRTNTFYIFTLHFRNAHQ